MLLVPIIAILTWHYSVPNRSVTEDGRRANQYLEPYRGVDDDRFRVNEPNVGDAKNI